MKRFHFQANWRGPAILAFVMLLVALNAFAMHFAKPPHINTTFGGASVEILAERAWVMPGQCVTFSWDLEGIHSLYIDGKGKIGWGDEIFCPSLLKTSPSFEITAGDGTSRALQLEIHYLPTEILAALLLTTALALIPLSAWYMKTMKLDGALPFRPWMPSAFAAAILCVLLGTATGLVSIPGLILAAGQLFTKPAWHAAALIPAALIFMPIIWDAIRRGFRPGVQPDLVAVVALAAFVMLLFLPFGLEGAAEWEGWDKKSYLDGRPSHMSQEYATRYWMLTPRVVANVLTPDSFVGLRLLSMCAFWGKLAIFYGILRQLRAPRAVAFLCATLYMTYPVNPMLLSLRAVDLNHYSLAIFAALYLALDCLKSPSRLRLAGIWLSLLLAFGAYESGLVLIIVIPLLWWLGGRRFGLERKRHMTVIWLIVMALPAAYLLLTVTAALPTRLADMSADAVDRAQALPDPFARLIDHLGWYYQYTFVDGWQEAIAAAGDNQWLLPTAAAMALIAAATIWLALREGQQSFPTRREIGIAFVSGLLLILPAVGVFVWFDKWSRDTWRAMIHVPIGAAIAVTSLALALASLVLSKRLRMGVFIGLCLLLQFPALSRLYVQHDFFVGGARNQATILRNIVALAPAFRADAHVVLLTDMGLKEMGDKWIYAFRRGVIDPVLWLLYQEARPAESVLCWDGHLCNPASIWGLENYDIRDLVKDTGKLVLMRLHEDLRVELLREIPPELGIANPESYNPDALIDYDAPLPPRAFTMLGAES